MPHPVERRVSPVSPHVSVEVRGARLLLWVNPPVIRVSVGMLWTPMSAASLPHATLTQAGHIPRPASLSPSTTTKAVVCSR